MDAYNILDIYKGLMYISKKVRQKSLWLQRKMEHRMQYM